jgi:hypothetical protein
MATRAIPCIMNAVSRRRSPRSADPGHSATSFAQFLDDLRSEGTEFSRDEESGHLLITAYRGKPHKPAVVLRVTPDEFADAVSPAPGLPQSTFWPDKDPSKVSYNLLLEQLDDFFSSGARLRELTFDGGQLVCVRCEASEQDADTPAAFAGGEYRWVAGSPDRDGTSSRRGRKRRPRR